MPDVDVSTDLASVNPPTGDAEIMIVNDVGGTPVFVTVPISWLVDVFGRLAVSNTWVNNQTTHTTFNRSGANDMRLALQRNGLTKGYLIAESGGIALTNADLTIEAVHVHNVTGAVSLSNAPSVAGPAATAVGHLSQVSAINAATGQLQLGGYEVGDTGDRNISADGENSNEWSLPGSTVLRRKGSTVWLYTNVTGLASPISDVVYTLPIGFRPGENIYPGIWCSTASPAVVVRCFVNTAGTVNAQSSVMDSGTWLLNAVWMTEDAWPSTLPGVAT